MIDVLHRHSGNEVVGFSVDVSKAPVPPRKYAADDCAIEVRDDQLRLIFVQRAIGGDESELETALVIRLAPYAAHEFVRTIFGMKDPTLEEIATGLQLKAAPLLQKLSRPGATANMHANLAAFAVSGHESCLDLYQASPFAMKDLKGKDTHQLPVEPVVRVELRTGLLLAIARGAKQAAAGLPSPLQHGA